MTYSIVLYSDNNFFFQSVLEKVLQVLRSEVLCTSNSITYPMFTLVCDCLSDHKGLVFDFLVSFLTLFCLFYFNFVNSLFSGPNAMLLEMMRKRF